MVPARRRQLVKQQGDLRIALPGEPLHVDPAALFLRKVKVGLLRFHERSLIVAWTGQSVEARLVHQQKRISVTFGMKWKTPVMFTGILQQLQTGKRNAVPMRAHEHERMSPNIGDDEDD